MKKRYGILLAAAGGGMLLLSFLVPFLKLMLDPPNIIGGAGLPTFLFLFRSKTAWLAWLGGLTALAGAAIWIFGKKTR